jgi:hypothetical protein
MTFDLSGSYQLKEGGRWGRWRVYDIRYAISLCILLRSDELRLNGLNLSKLCYLFDELECSSTIKITIPSMHSLLTFPDHSLQSLNVQMRCS